MFSIDPKRIRYAAIMVNAVLMKVALIGGGYYLGRVLDQKYQLTYLAVMGAFVGLILGVWWIIFTANRFKL